jgi:hypothetical protein
MAVVKAKAPIAAPQAINLNDLMKQARTNLHTAKDRAMHAAAQCYIIWAEAQTAKGKAWFEKAVADENKLIADYNKGVADDRKEVTDYNADKLDSSHAVKYEGSDAAALKEKADAIARIKALAQLITEDRAPKKKLKIEKTESGNEFTMVVKLVFAFDQATHASLVSRYSTVCAFIHDKCNAGTPKIVANIVAALEAAGGFEAAYRLQVKAKKTGKTVGTAAEIETMAKQAQADNKAAVEAMKPLSSFDMPVKTNVDGFMVLLARTNGTAVEVIGEAPVTEAQVKKLVTSFEAPAIVQHPVTEFVQRVLSLGDLVGGVVGKATEKKKERKLILRPMADGKTQLVMTLLGGDANVVVHAVPHEHVNIGTVSGMTALSHEHLDLLTQRIGDPLYRRFTALEADAAPTTSNGGSAKSPLGWNLVNAALADDKGVAKCEKLYWPSVTFTKSPEKPVDVEALTAKVRLTLSRDVLLDFWEAALSPAKSDNAANKKTKSAALTYENGTLVLDVAAKHNAEHDVVSELDGAVDMKFRPDDLIALVKKLKDLMVDQFTFEFDDNGILGVFWSDAYGNYAVFQPTVLEGGQLNNKRLTKTAGAAAVNLMTAMAVMDALAANKRGVKSNRAAAAQITTTPAKRAPAKKVVAA